MARVADWRHVNSWTQNSLNPGRAAVARAVPAAVCASPLGGSALQRFIDYVLCPRDPGVLTEPRLDQKLALNRGAFPRPRASSAKRRSSATLFRVRRVPGLAAT